MPLCSELTEPLEIHSTGEAQQNVGKYQANYDTRKFNKSTPVTGSPLNAAQVPGDHMHRRTAAQTYLAQENLESGQIHAPITS